jgi:uncharacterized membrane protein
VTNDEYEFVAIFIIRHSSFIIHHLLPMPEAISEYFPQLARDAESARRARAAWAAWAAVLACAAVLVALAVAAPLLRARGAAVTSQLVYAFFHAACHQIPERSFHVGGYAFAVCARCFGIYVGALLGVAAYPLARAVVRTDAPERRWLLLAAVPTAIDFALGVTGVWANTHWSRFSTGLLLGAAAAFYIVPGLVDLCVRMAGRLRRRGPSGGFESGDSNLRASCG